MLEKDTTSIPRLLNLKDAARYLSICSRKLSVMAKEGRVPSLHIDRCLRFDKADLDEFISSLKTGVRPNYCDQNVGNFK